MSENGNEQLLLKLQQLFDGREDLISSGGVSVCLTATVISFLNNCFNNSQYYSESQKCCVEFLKRSIPIVHTLKILPGPTFKFTSVVDISFFQGIQVLEISKLAIEFISGLQSLRTKVRYLKTNQSFTRIKDILALCGSDQSTEFTWPYLEHVDFSFNNVNHLDSSLRLLTSIKTLNLSHNGLEAADRENWMYLPEISWLHIGYNQLKKIPCFPEHCCLKITSLFLTNNDLDNLEGLEVLTNLEVLDISMNCICEYSSCFPLACLQKLVSLKCFDNPIAYNKDYRPTIISYLSPTPRNVTIVFDDKPLDVHEMCMLGSCVELDLNALLPLRPFGTPVMNISRPVDAETLLQQSTEYSTPSRTPDDKRKARKAVIRQPSIRTIGDEEDVIETVTAPFIDDQLEESGELEKLEKFKKDTGEDYLVVRNQKELEQYKTGEKPVLAPLNTEPGPSSPTSLNSPEGSLHALTEAEMDMVVHAFASSLPVPGEESHLEDVFVSVKDDSIVERDIHSKVKLILDLRSLLDVNVISMEDSCTTAVQLKFDYVSLIRKNREYIFKDDGNGVCSKDFLSLIQPFVKTMEERSGATTQKSQIKCLNCLAIFPDDQDLTECARCRSPLLFDVSQPAPSQNLPQQDKFDSARTTTLSQDPDIIPKVLHFSDVRPDICSDSWEQDCNELDDDDIDGRGNKDHEDEVGDDHHNSDGDYGVLVSSIQLKAKDYEDNFGYFKDTQTNDLSISPKRNESQALDISDQQFPRESFASSASDPGLSGSSRTSTPVPGRTQSAMHFSMDSCRYCDHRLKLYFETRMFKEGENEEFGCMIKCPMVSYGFSKGTPALLVISNMMVYICKITAFESAQPNEWLLLKDSYQLTELRHLEYGLQNQSFRLEFAQRSGCHTFLVGDSKRCEDFLQTLRAIVKKRGDRNIGKLLSVSQANPQTLANLRIQIFGVKDESLIVKGRRLYEQVVNFTHPPLVRDRKVWFRTLPHSMLGREFIDWLISHKEAMDYRDALQVGQLLLDGGVIQAFDKDSSLLEANQYYFFNLSQETPTDNESDSSEGIVIKYYFLAKWDTSSNNKDADSRLVPVSIIVTNTHIALAEENHQWPLPRFHEPPISFAGPQFVFITSQRITNITEADINAERVCDLELEFHDENVPGDDRDARWHFTFESENSLQTFLEGVREIWEKQFDVELPINLVEKAN